MKLISCSVDGQASLGVLKGGRIQRIAGADMLSLITAGGAINLVDRHDDLAQAVILPPLRPGKILAIGRNYAEHARELDNAVPDEPLVFAVLPSAVIGPGDVIEWESDLTAQVDWEGELAVIIGKRARHVPRGRALEHVFGYTIANDISARDLQTRDKQWIRAKGMDTFCPLGPCIVTADEIRDPQALRIVTRVDGAVMQDGATADMIFGVPELIAWLSRAFTLDPGDVILTGTPSGVGKGMDPPRFLSDGSVVSVEIEPIGKLTNRCRVLPPPQTPPPK